MDMDEEAVAESAGSSACKRQKRNNSSGAEGCGDNDPAAIETEIAVGAAAQPAAEAAAPSVDASALSEMDIILLGFAANRKETSNAANSNNNNNSGADDNTLEMQTNNDAVATPSTTTTNADDDTVESDATDEQQLSDAEADDDDDADADSEKAEEAGATLATFNRPRMLGTRAYRSTLSSNSSSNSDISQANDDQSATNSDNTNDTDVEDGEDGDDGDEGDDGGDGDDGDDGDDVDDGTIDEAGDEASGEEEQASPTASPGLEDDSSSDSSMAIWNRYYTSSNEPDSDDGYADGPANADDKLQVETAVNNVMNKPKPLYTLNLADQLMQREHNITNRIGWRGGHTSGTAFIQGYYGSRQVVERMTLTENMSFHLGCVNSLNFNRSGDLLCSGSDDLSIIVWDWASGKPRHRIRSGHTLNIFQTKFLDSAGCLDIVSSSRDGQVRRAVIPPSGASKVKPTRLYNHSEAVHKLVVVPQSRFEVMSAGEDSAVKHYDLRTNNATTMLRCLDNKRRVRLFSIAHHPFAPEFCISGSDEKLRVFDKRKLSAPLQEMTPKDIKDIKITQITCAVYNYNGTEILASYSDAGIYLFDSRNYKDGEYLHSYEGHINSRTIKGANFFGPRSEYVVSGSDCGNIFFWDKNTEAVINYKKGDLSGVVNCLEPHPWMPVLATSGLEHKVKIWTPSGLPDSIPQPEALKETLQRNFRRSIMDLGDFDINHIHYFIRQLIEPRRTAPGQATAQPRSYSSSSDSSSNDSNPNSPLGGHPSSSDEGNPNPIGCNTQ
ncbi:hypothetical protein KR093_002042 [Drosophila rubida]|uniref:DDB1- and CUL4-associated factor 8 n=1 Tax=Drosophila rubida TaxID=30044 RepID=A0AAD4JXI6_9MUSC|nr:hypothetical protein KR093_002042 [Drosophila rubida]